MRMLACRHDFAFEIEANISKKDMRSMSMAIYEYSQNCGNAKHGAVRIIKTYTF